MEMDIFDTRYFNINKKLLTYTGLWPYQTGMKKVFSRIAVTLILVAITVPQIIRCYLHIGKDMDIFVEHIAVVIFMSALFLKLYVSFFHEEKLKTVYESVAKYWLTITDEEEREILVEFAERGRLLTLGYTIYCFGALGAFISLPPMPMVLNRIMPLNESRPLVFILGGDFFIDRQENYAKIFVFDFFCCICNAFVLVSFDTMYAACIEHLLAYYAIIKFRLRMPIEGICKRIGSADKEDAALKFIIDTIHLHKKVLSFSDTLERSYSTSFLLLMGVNMIMLSFESILVLIKLGEIFELIRFSAILFGIVVHLFFISWPGQKLIDSSGGLFEDTYTNEWYDRSTKAQKLMGFMALRCMTPCKLTAGGLYVMNFENFASIVKTSMSYMTLFASFR